MALMSAMYSSSSAMGMFGQAMGVIGNNMANTGTTGFKASQVTFQDVLSQSVGTTVAEGHNQVGNGASLGIISQNFQQGTFEQTGMSTDMAIDGPGYFQVREPNGSGLFYTRAGNFQHDRSGALVTSDGMALQGIAINAVGEPEGPAVDVVFDGSVTSSTKASSMVNIAANLDSTATVPTNTYNPNDATSYNFSINSHIYDSQGGGHDVEIQFRKESDNTWAWYPVVPTADLKIVNGDNVLSGAERTAALLLLPELTATTVNLLGESPPEAIPSITLPAEKADSTTYANGQLSFDGTGHLLTEGAPPVTFAWGNGALSQDVMFDFGRASDPMGDSSNDFGIQDANLAYTTTGTAVADTPSTSAGSTVQFASPSSTLSLDQDGYPTGFMDNVSVTLDGVIVGSFSNGQKIPLYQVQLATFTNEGGLETAGKNLYSASLKSGEATTGLPKSGKFGSVVGNSLEQSNVDISQEVIRMISTQRAFQANSRIVSIVDGMLEELVNLKR